MPDQRKRSTVTRRTLLKLGAAGGAALGAWPAQAQDDEARRVLSEAIARLSYLTPAAEFREFVREKPRIDELPSERLRAVGLDRDTWQLEVVPDPESNCKVERPLARQQGNALTWQGLMQLAEKHAVRFLKLLTCTNVSQPQGMALWEGVPLREVVWMTRPTGNVRRVCYWGYHNDDPKQRFVSSLAVGRVLEDPPGELPVILCYKLNGQWLTPKQGGPVRMVVPEAYGNKSVKWLTHVMLTNHYQANDTYALWNNDVETAMKTQARFLPLPEKVKAGQAVALVGVAQVGLSGLSKVQYLVQPDGANLPAGDAQAGKGEWRVAEILPPPEHWGKELPGGKLPPIPLQFDPATGKPRAWPLRYAMAQWAAVLTGLKPGQYRLSCRTIDARGVAQPMPRPFPKSGNNAIHTVRLAVES